MLGLPIEDRDRVGVWVSALIRTIEPPQNVGINEAEEEESALQAAMQMREYLCELIATRRHEPGDDLISALVVATTSHNDAGQMNEQELLASVSLLIGAGYETTVNLITNGMLTLLRHPDVLAKLRHDPAHSRGGAAL